MKRALLALSLAGLFLAAAPATAQFPDQVPDTFRIRFGVMYSWFNTQLLFDEFSGTNPGVTIDLENVSNLPSSKAGPWFYGNWNFAGRSYLDFGFLYFNRSKTTTTSQDITFGDTTYSVGESVETSFKTAFPYAAYRYNFVKDPSVQLGLSLGVTYASMKAEFSGVASATGPGGTAGTSVTKAKTINAWVPLIGMTFDAKVADNMSAGIQVMGAGATITPYKGWTIMGNAHFDYYFAQNFGMGLGYQYSHFDIKRTQSTSSLEFDYEFNGPIAYITLTF